MKSDWDPVEKKLRCVEAIHRTRVDDARRFLLAQLVHLYVELDAAQAERFTAEVEKEGHEEVRKMVITWEDALAARQAEGEIRGLVTAILRVLKRRLKTVSAFVRQKLEAIQSRERLEEILDQAVVVNSVDELVLEP